MTTRRNWKELRNLYLDNMVPLRDKSSKSFAEWLANNREVEDIVNYKGKDYIIVEINQFAVILES